MKACCAIKWFNYIALLLKQFTYYFRFVVNAGNYKKLLIKELSISPSIKNIDFKRDLKTIFYLPYLAPGKSFLAKTIYLIFVKKTIMLHRRQYNG